MMVIHRLAEALRKQGWFTVAIEFVIVVAGIFLPHRPSNGVGAMISSVPYLSSLSNSTASQTQSLSDLLHLFFGAGVHARNPAPAAIGFRRHLVGGIDAHFATQPGFGAGEIQVINGRVFDQHSIAHRIGAGGYGSLFFTFG